MTTAQQQFSAFATEQIEVAMRFARISLDSSERLIKLQVETAADKVSKVSRLIIWVRDTRA